MAPGALRRGVAPLRRRTAAAVPARACRRCGSTATTPQAVVPAGVWQAAEPVGGAVLCGCTVAPGFEFEDFELGSAEALVASFRPRRAAHPATRRGDASGAAAVASLALVAARLRRTALRRRTRARRRRGRRSRPRRRRRAGKRRLALRPAGATRGQLASRSTAPPRASRCTSSASTDGRFRSLLGIPLEGGDTLAVTLQPLDGARTDTRRGRAARRCSRHTQRATHRRPAVRPARQRGAARGSTRSWRRAAPSPDRRTTRRGSGAGAFVRPRPSRITSVYGTGREFNGAVTSRHLGTDFAGSGWRAGARGRTSGGGAGGATSIWRGTRCISITAAGW